MQRVAYSVARANAASRLLSSATRSATTPVMVVTSATSRPVSCVSSIARASSATVSTTRVLQTQRPTTTSNKASGAVARLVASRAPVIEQKHSRAFHATPVSAFRIGETVPDFTQESTEGPIQFHKWIGNDWVLLVSHPADFTPVCTTELAELEKLVPELKKRGVKALGLSCDKLPKHVKWSKDVLEFGNIKKDKLSYPILADYDRKVAKLFGMLPDDPNLKDEEGLPLTVRSVYLIDPNKKIRLEMTYPSSTGRYWPEVIRAIDSIKLAARHPIATPHGWKEGDKVVVVPSMSTDEAKKRFPDVEVVKPYLRFIPQPK